MQTQTSTYKGTFDCLMKTMQKESVGLKCLKIKGLINIVF